ncbi:glycosyltransferase family 2 protein [Stenotrophomonas geniculata]|uniref:glycosyltransferase family 2 protein n=1 Tax=Stenotrophomonas geniculata TaxID=86188 RepID=UPI0039C650FD
MSSLVSIYIPTFNRLEMLQRAIHSVCSQTYDHLEVLVVDDCSSDGTRAYLEHLPEQDARIRVFLKDANSGACASRNIALRNCRGVFATGLDDDDYVLPSHVQELIDCYQSKERAGLSDVVVFPQMATRGEDGEVRKMHQPLARVDFGALKVKNYIGNQVFARTDRYSDAGLFDERLPAWQDYDLWLRMAARGAIMHKSPAPTYIYEDDQSSQKISNAKYERILGAYNIVSSQNSLNLSRREKLILKMNYFRYTQAPMSIGDLAAYVASGIVLSPSKTYVKKVLGKAFGMSQTKGWS